MIQIVEKNVQRSFSRSAARYESLSGLQQRIGEELLFKSQNIQGGKKAVSFLDVGMGTGRMTHQLSRLFSASNIVGVDFATGMVSYAKQKYDSFHIVQADAASLPFCENAFDVILSNSAYQWIVHLEEAFNEACRVLKKDARLCAAMFAKGSLNELFESLKYSLSPGFTDDDLPIKRLPEKEQITKAVMGAGFKHVQCQSEIIKVNFADMFALTRWLKRIGANANEKNIYVGKNSFLKANEYYRKNFSDNGSVAASFEVVWINAIK